MEASIFGLYVDGISETYDACISEGCVYLSPEGAVSLYLCVFEIEFEFGVYSLSLLEGVW